MQNYKVELFYADYSKSEAVIQVETLADAMMIARGWLHASGIARLVYLWNAEGDLVASYMQ